MKKKLYEIKDSIGVFDNFIDNETCKNVILNYEKDSKKNLAFTRNQNEQIKKNLKDDTTVIYHHNLHWNPSLNKILESIKETFKIYDDEKFFTEFCNVNELHFTYLRVQKTLPSQGYHVWHVEKDYQVSTCTRAIVFSVYLNDILDGGETEFLIQKKRIKPVTGRICIFPSYYPYIHRGNPPLNSHKYILTSWLLTNRI